MSGLKPGSQMRPEVRRFEAGEWPLYRQLRLRALQDAPEAFCSSYAVEAARPDEQWAQRLADAAVTDKDLPLLALLDAQPCGQLWCKLDAADPGLAHLFQMWVAPEARGSGVGRALLLAALDWARRAGAGRVELGVTLSDSPAARLYARHGFANLGLPQPLREGSGLMVQNMACRLSE